MSKSVAQRHAMGCGVACVASVLGVSYDQSLQLFGEPKNAWTKGYSCKTIVQALSRGGKKYRFRKAHAKDCEENLTEDGTIVFTDYKGQYPSGHYLVRIKGKWMNPWVNCPDMIPVRAGFVKELPARPIWIFYEV